MPVQATSGSASYDGYGGGAAAVPLYIEDVFKTWLYSGNGSTQTITNGIDLSTKGGLVWGKSRTNAGDHFLTDTVRGNTKPLVSGSTAAQATSSVTVTGFNTTGFSVGAGDIIGCNNSGQNYVSWTFRKQPKFFDVVTYTGNGTAKTISHSLGSVPGCMIVKCTSVAGENWAVYHRSLGATKYIELNLTDAASTSVGSRWDAEPTSTSFSVGYNGSVNTNGATYVAYLFAHDAGGFGLTGTDNVISCGSYTGNGGAQTISLGYEPQWVLIKRADGITQWNQFDNLRGYTGDPTNGSKGALPLNYNATESSGSDSPYSTSIGLGFSSGNANYNGSGASYIYIAIRRGPMKVPTTGTSVFTPDVGRTDYVTPQFDSTFPVVDTVFEFLTNTGVVAVLDRLRGDTQRLKTYLTDGEVSSNIPMKYMYGVGDGASTYDRAWMFGRAPGCYDVVCYKGTGTARTVTHNLGVAPTLMIVKCRSQAGTYWHVYNSFNGATDVMYLDSTYGSFSDSSAWNNTAPTSSVFTVNNNGSVNDNNQTYVAYLFATCPGVSKVGSYSGNGGSQTINCGFTSGARFVMIKRANSSGSWYVWDTARGISYSNDPYILLNGGAAETTGTNYIDPNSTGFDVVTSNADINASGGTYIFLAFA